MTQDERSAAGHWSAERYAKHAGFVPELGGEIIAWLAPGQGERILDLGCGDGSLTLRIADAGAQVVGVDASEEMIAVAKRRGIDARRVNGEALNFAGEFDAVFSNAALHWMQRADAVAGGVANALKPGGRFVAEFGGHGNVAAIATALHAELGALFGANVGEFPWYFPTEAEYRSVLENAGLEVLRSALVARPTLLPTSMEGWLDTFVAPHFEDFAGAHREQLMTRIVDLLRPSLCDKAGQWTADYVRLRVEARRPS